MLKYINQIKNIIIPSLCICCRSEIDDDDKLCSNCWSSINFIMEPFCEICGIPFEFESNKKLICSNCLKKPPLYKKGRSVLAYDDNSKKIILPFKHCDEISIGKLIAKWSYQRYPDIFDDIDILLPVPLHWTRLLKRQYNQSAIICSHL